MRPDRLLKAALLLGLLGCGTAEPGTAAPYVILRIEDPNQLAALGGNSGAPVLVLTDASGNKNRFDGMPHGFPVTVTLTSERQGPQRVTVDLWFGVLLMARGTATVDVEAQNKQEVAVALDLMCALEGSCPPVETPIDKTECSVSGDCDDGVFCNGLETCEDGVCQSGTPPCPSVHGGCLISVCQEASDTCESVPNDDACPPLDGNSTYCDPELGCQERSGPDPTCAQSGGGLSPDGTPCGVAPDDPRVCYSGDCVDPSFETACDDSISMGFFADGQIAGGQGHGLTVNHLQFPQTGDGVYNPQWVVADNDLRPGDPVVLSGSSNRYMIDVLAPYRLASFRIRSQTGTRCTFTTIPAGNATAVSSTKFTTVRLNTQPGATGLRIIFSCAADKIAQMRVDDFCLVSSTE